MSKSEYLDLSISTFISVTGKRSDGLGHVHEQFSDRPEFDVQIKSNQHSNTSEAKLWQNFIEIIETAIHNTEDVIIITTDEHQFTRFYNRDYLFSNIIQANEQGVALLTGGVGKFGQALPLTENRYWIDSFSSTQFVVLFSRIFNDIVTYQFKKNDLAIRVLSDISSHKMTLYPFISEQRDIDNSDPIGSTEVRPAERNMLGTANERLEKIQFAYIKYIKSNPSIC